MNSGMGKAIVATWPDDAIEALVARHGLRRLTGRSLRSMSAVREDIEAIRQRGYAYDDEEFTSGMRCVASVVWSATGEPLWWAVGLCFGRTVDDFRHARNGERVRDLALELTQRWRSGTPATGAR